jgi:hypothetical protein
MPLLPVPRPVGPTPPDIRAFLREADRRIRRYERRNRNFAFVPCNVGGIYGILQHLAAHEEAAGTLFCEWGSGFGSDAGGDESVAGTPGVVDKAENRSLHTLVTLRKCSTLYNFPTNSPSNTARAPAGGTYSVNPV